ncbi:MAG TPA: DUF3489 domain-containing protein [Bryobacteraceae bacterium]|nr:DUF3489 domain-containing protein [Bryobacteraceae bacterium]HWR35366.1 DUF3489 domain-containing protein [Clostridia bacterium]
MKVFTIDSENRVWAFTSAAQHRMDAQFSTERGLMSATATWPASRLLAIWAGLPGSIAVKKFTDRKTAVRRIWNAVQTLTPSESRSSGTGNGRRPTSKQSQVLGLLKRAQGATLQDIVTATGWQPHSVRGFLSGVVRKKMKLALRSSQSEIGQRAYSLDLRSEPTEPGEEAEGGPRCQ